MHAAMVSYADDIDGRSCFATAVGSLHLLIPLAALLLKDF